MRAFETLSRYFHTIRYLKPAQIYGRIPRWRPRLSSGVVPALRPIEGDWIREPFDARKSRTAAARFRFLNQEREVATWDDLEVPLLWIFNLNYFETPESDLIEDFVRRSTPNAGRSWH